MSLSPDALEAYARDYLRDRRADAAHAALVAQARQTRQPTAVQMAIRPLALTVVAHLAVLVSPLSLALLRLARR